LLARLFGHHKSNCDSACDACGCGEATGCSGCSSSSEAAASDAAPVPPAPVVDPSAYLNSKRRVIQASSYTR
jgi:hypothetical protein